MFFFEWQISYFNRLVEKGVVVMNENIGVGDNGSFIHEEEAESMDMGSIRPNGRVMEVKMDALIAALRL